MEGWRAITRHEVTRKRRRKRLKANKNVLIYFYQNNEWTSHENKEAEPVQTVQMNTCTKVIPTQDFGWLHFYNNQGFKRGRNTSPTYPFL